VASPAEARLGRPPKVDDSGLGTRERLLVAAAASCVEHGFEGATVADIARRADVSAPAIYNHFGGKVELLVAAGRAALARLGRPPAAGRPSAAAVARTFLEPDFAPTRRLLVELHLAAGRHPQVAALLADWQAEQAQVWRPATGRDRDAVVKAFFALLLGLCQIESLSALPASPAALARRTDALVAALYPEEELP
jgi:AcrR family transcriptional regulator